MSVVGLAVFCLLTTFAAPDASLLGHGATVAVPFAGVSVSFLGFLLVGPLLLVGSTVYLHIMYGAWLDLDRRQPWQRVGAEPSAAMLRRVALFSLDHPVPRILSSFLLNFLPPIVLVVLTWKAGGRLDYSFPIGYSAGAFGALLLFLQIRRAGLQSRRYLNPLLWGVLVLLAILGLVAPYHRDSFHRPLDLRRAQLKDASLEFADLRNADASLADFRNSRLYSVTLRQANLERATFRQADLKHVDLRGGFLYQTDLTGADLWSADLRAALLWDTQFFGAKLSSIDAQGAFFVNASMARIEISFANLAKATLAACDLTETELFQADLADSYFVATRLDNAKLTGSNLRESQFIQVTFGAASFRNADLRGARFLEGFPDSVSAELEGRFPRPPQGPNLDPSVSRLLSVTAALAASVRLLKDMNRPVVSTISEGRHPPGLMEAAAIDFGGADLRAADLRGLRGLTRKQIRSAKTDESTRLPSYIRPRG